ncbi:MAG: hypothetical protein FWG20_04520 [Candidatus Cloacimonetes bacterium]|nr:hypothetical protein [Candidatus Cloacimonadota bacterium]
MNNKQKKVGTLTRILIVLMLTFGLVVLCQAQPTEQMLKGKWTREYNDTGDTHICSFENGAYESYSNGMISTKGTYTVTDDIIVITTTHISGPGTDCSKLLTRNEYEAAYQDFVERIASIKDEGTEKILNDLFPKLVYYLDIAGDKMSLSYDTKMDTETLGMSFEELQENSKSFRNHKMSPDKVTMEYTRS